MNHRSFMQREDNRRLGLDIEALKYQGSLEKLKNTIDQKFEEIQTNSLQGNRKNHKTRKIVQIIREHLTAIEILAGEYNSMVEEKDQI